MKGAILGILAILGLPNHAMAQFTGTTLSMACAGETKQETTSCNMWISGFQAGLFAAQAAGKINRSACIPNGVTGYQAVQIVKQFLQDNPAMLHKPADVLAFMAISQAFPCKNAN